MGNRGLYDRVHPRDNSTKTLALIQNRAEVAFRRVSDTLNPVADDAHEHFEGETTAELVVAVSPTGSDEATDARPALLRPTDYSRTPYATLQGALDAVRRHRQFAIQNDDQDVTIRLEAGTYAGASLEGLAGGGTVTLTGTWVPVSPTTGVVVGTAGAGTSSTAIKKPAAAANWTAADFDGSFVRLLSGGGSPAVRPIVSNTTDTLTIHAAGGADSTSVFEIVFPATTIEGTTTLANWTPNVTFDACIFDGVDLVVDDCAQVAMTGCVVDSPADATISRCRYVSLTDCAFTDGSAIQALRCNDVQAERVLVWDNSTLTVSHALRAVLDVHAVDANTTPVSVQFCQHVQMGIDSSDNTGSGVLIESCKVESYGTGYVGTGNSGYGMDVQGFSWVDATGATITGTTNDFRCGEVADTWANLTTRESYIDKGTNILVIT